MPPGFRADAVLEQRVTELWESAVSVSTRSAYRVGLQCLLTFMTMSGVIFRQPNLPPLTEDCLIYFVTYCHSCLRLRWTTIKLYLAGIRFHYLQAGHNNPFDHCDRLQCIIRGIKRSQMNISKPRLPIDSKILNQICGLLKRGLFSPFIDKTLECMCMLAFYGFLRCSEFTVRSLKAPYQYLRISDVQFSQDKSMFTLFLASSKTDPFRKGTQILYFQNNKLCPVSCMLSYLTTYRKEPLNSCAPLFVDSKKQPFSREAFITYLRDILTRLGYKDSDYCGHSLRIGAATSAAAAGIEDHLIKTLGRWNSSCYIRYIRVPRSTIKDAQSKLHDGNRTYWPS